MLILLSCAACDPQLAASASAARGARSGAIACRCGATVWNHRLATFARANLGAPIDARAMQRPELPTIRGCPIYVHDALRLVRPSLHPRYLHCAWRHHQHAMQHWVDRAALHWPWQAANARSAMVVWLGGHQLSESCPAELLQDLHRQKLGVYDPRAGVPNCSHLTSADRSMRAAEQQAIKSLHRSGGVEWLPSGIERSKRMFWEQLMRATATPENRSASGALPQLRTTAITTSECQRPYGSIGLVIW